MGNRIYSKFSRNKEITIIPSNKIANMSVVPNTINNINCSDMNTNKDISYKDKINTPDHCITTDVTDDQIFSEEGECLFEGAYKISVNKNSDELSNGMIDFEDLIDLTVENESINTLHNIKEFENVLCSINPSATVNNISENISLGEINDFFDNLGTENDLNSQTNLNVHNNEKMNFNIDDIVEANGIQNEYNENLIEKHTTSCIETREHDVTINNINGNLPEMLTNEPQDNNEASLTMQVEDIVQNINKNSRATPMNDILKHNIGENSSKTPNNDVTIVSTNDIPLKIQDCSPIHGVDLSTERIETDVVIDIDSISPTKEDVKENEPDTISILSSNEPMQSEGDDGYNSSDFEFITENEANMDGYIINFSSNEASTSESKNAQYNDKIPNNEPCNSDELNSPAENRNISHAGECSRGLNRARDYRQNHVIPEGDGYLDLFQGPYNPIMPMCDIIMLENKSTRPSAMNVQYEGIGFDRQLIERRYHLDSSEEEHEDEAKESIKKILFLYPGENRKRRRRY